jgi:PucR family transcriptional regulator, purine catabolism regulatory protein
MTPEQLVEFAESLARIAAGGGGPKALATRLAEATGGSVLVEDADWRHVAGAGEPVPSSARGGSSNGSLVAPIRAGTLEAGWVSLARAPGAGNALRLTAAAIGVELARDANGSRGRRRTFWERLLAGAYHDAAAAREDAAARGIVAAPSYLAIALEPEPLDDGRPPAEPAELRAVASEAFRNGNADLGFYERGATLLVFVPVTRELDASNARTAAALLPKSILKRKVPIRLSGGAGSVEPLLSIARAAELAQSALAIGRRIHGAGCVAVYDDLGAYPLLYEGSDVERLRAFAARVLAPLRAYDDKHATELERTLKLYFGVGENVKTAAAQLNVHRHTVFYRLRQIGEICAISLESPGDQLTLRLAVAIDVLHSQ